MSKRLTTEISPPNRNLKINYRKANALFKETNSMQRSQDKSPGGIATQRSGHNQLSLFSVSKKQTFQSLTPQSK